MLAVSVAACSANPLGIDDDEWAQMTPTQQALATEKERELAEVRVDNPSGLLVLPAPVGHAMDEGRRLRVEERRRRDRFGDTLTCHFEDIAASFDGRWSVAYPLQTSIVRGEFQALPLTETASEEREAVWLDYSDSGNTLRLCSGVSDRGHFLGCATMVAAYRDLVEGMQWQVTLPGVMEATVVCAFKPGVAVTVSQPD
ncbi:hypothetical protein GCM10027256_06080 [Novispirillum itersonii subsp. nipponicum]